jgi:hypothetical protein
MTCTRVRVSSLEFLLTLIAAPRYPAKTGVSSTLYDLKANFISGTNSNMDYLTNLILSAVPPSWMAPKNDDSSHVDDPVQRALEIDEVFLLILSFVNNQMLLSSALRVNKRWHFFVLQAPELQRKLFFQLPVQRPVTPDDIEINPLLDHVLELIEDAEPHIRKEKQITLHNAAALRRSTFWNRVVWQAQLGVATYFWWVPFSPNLALTGAMPFYQLLNPKTR